MKRVLIKVWNNFERVCVVTLFAMILITIFIQIVMRILFNNPLMFTEELARFLYLWMIFLGFSIITRMGSNLCIDIVSQKIYGRKKAYFSIVIDCISIVMFVFIFFHSIDYVEFSWANPAPALQIPMGIVYLVVPISMLLCTIRSVERIVQHIKRLLAGDQFHEYSQLASQEEIDLIGGGPYSKQEEK